MKKILYIVLDGLGDRPIRELDDKTPLEAASIPNLNSLVGMSKCGLVYPVGKDIAPESDIAVISLLGFDAEKYYTGRGPLECFAEKLTVRPGDLAYRVNFATLGENNRILDRRVGRDLSTQEATELAKEINSKIILTDATFEFKNTIGHRGVLVIRSNKLKLSGWVNNTDPAYERKGVFGLAKEDFDNVLLECSPMPGYEQDPAALMASSLTNEFVRKVQEVLNKSSINESRRAQGKLPANVILTRDAGDKLPDFPSVKEKFGLRFGSLIEMPVERGIALLTGMSIVELPATTGNLKKDYIERAKLTLEKIEDYDGLYIHIKGPDEPAHDGNFLKKREIIELIDRFFFGIVLEGIKKKSLEKSLILTVTADHSTPCSLKAHSDDPVPIMVFSATEEPDGITVFSESACRGGSLGEIKGQEIMPILVGFARD
jgi:2,3-bisphosphoglycerate-independent phosphoglycerate mutase